MSQYFSPKGGCEQAIVDAINNATTTLDIAMYSFTDKAIAQAILDAYNRLSGTSSFPVRIIFDKSETHGTQATFHDQFEAAGIPISVYAPHGGIMHNKYGIIDNHIVINGSFNWTERAQNSNCENIQIHDDTQLANAYSQNFDAIWALAGPEPIGITRSLSRTLRSMKSVVRPVA